jgi:hypothetical protein
MMSHGEEWRSHYTKNRLLIHKRFVLHALRQNFDLYSSFVVLVLSSSGQTQDFLYDFYC